MPTSGPLGALLSSPALDVRLLTALQVLQARGAVRRVRVCDCDEGPLTRDHWVCIINNEGALKKKEVGFALS